MGKRLSGTTLIFDATERRYLRTEMYAADDPSATVELRILDDQNPRFCDINVDQGSGPWRRITKQIEAVPEEVDASVARRRNPNKRSPNACGEWPAMGTSKTLDGMPTLSRD